MGLVDSKDINGASARAVLTARHLRDVLDKALDSLASLNTGSLEPALVQAVLGKTEASLAHVQKSIGSVLRSAATDDIEKAKKSLATLEQATREWREVYPDTSAVKIDNSKPLHLLKFNADIARFQVNTSSI